ncbi:MAG TPA: CbiX/SirB N-terminal domain-containing protein [Candidatus Lokiarchaeia archaeon]|nr:CbiX/SirB N-terminal domain-containing protein [Candidatus Lokiarchaeia archaeon]
MSAKNIPGTIIVLAMHGVPPLDFQPRELGEFMSLHYRAEFGGRPLTENEQEREKDLESQIIAVERTPENDPYHAASFEIGSELHELTGVEVLVGFNEFCAPTLHDVLDEAAGKQPEKIVVITPMLTAGGEHSEKDIPAAIETTRQQHPGILIEYAWPFNANEIAQFLADHFERYNE